MPREYIVSLCAILGAIAFVALIFAFPPIISRDGIVSRSTEVQEASDLEIALKRQEHAYCRSNLDDVNCNCFARKAGHILAQPQPEIFGYTYADRSDLARGRGQHKC